MDGRDKPGHDEVQWRRGIAFNPQHEEGGERVVKKPQTFLLPWPPSVNGMWRSVRGRTILSQRYRLWRDAAAKTLAMQRPKHVLGPVRVAIELIPPDARRYDVDNRVKPVLDLLVACAVIDGDDHLTVREVTVSACDGFARAHADGARVTVAPFAGG